MIIIIAYPWLAEHSQNCNTPVFHPVLAWFYLVSR